ncbi:MAG TPA: DedA family protein [Acidimicrobiales bacterium]|nr:DedA family protein [Acidimicrobiales bacterium]
MQSFVQNYGYWALLLLSIAESACVPIPSEVTFVVAGALCTTAVTGHVQFSLWAVIVIGTVGSVIGSQIAYEVGRSAGRTVVDRWGKWILLSHKDLDTSERWFAKYGAATVLIGRVLPVVRSVISVPAGIAEMKRGPFVALTALGSAAWVALLSGLGYAAGKNWHRVSKDFHTAQTPTIAVIVVLVVVAIVLRVRSTRRADAR